MKQREIINKKLIKGVLLFLLLICTSAYSQSLPDKINALMKTYADHGLFSGAVLVANKDSIVYNGAFGIANREYDIPNAPQTKFKISSDTKTFTAQLILNLHNKGLLKLDDSVRKYIPELDAAKFQSITIHHLISNTSGLPHDSRFIGMPDFVWERHVLQQVSTKDWINLINRTELAAKPGEKFIYSSPNFHLAGAIIERVTKKSYNETLQELIAKPLGLKDTIYADNRAVIKGFAEGYEPDWQFTSDGKIFKTYIYAPYRNYSTEGAAAAIVSTTEDLYKFYKALNNYTLLPKNVQDLMFKKYAETPDWTWRWYGYGMGLDDGKGIGFDYPLNYSTHGGFGFGHRSQVVNVERGEWIIATLSNIGYATNHWNINYNILQLINNKKLATLGANPADVIAEKLINEGTAEAWKFFKETSKQKEHPVYLYSESRLNAEGYALLNLNLLPQAIEVFKMNIELYPNSANVYDSLADAYEAKKETQLAIKYAKRALEVLEKSPNLSAEQRKNIETSARQKLDRLQKNNP